jgi:hypothetical protein
MLRNEVSPTDLRFLIALIALAGCSYSGQSSVEQDTAITRDDVSNVAETAPTLDTGADQSALAAAVTPQVVEYILATQPSADANSIQLGRPWGEFQVHRGPQLVFLGYWRMLASMSGNYFAVVDVMRDGDSYKMRAIGSVQFIPTMVEREKIPAVSAALDQGRAGFFRCVGEGGESLLAYEEDSVVDAGLSEIRVQPLGSHSRFRGIDAGASGIAEMSLAEFEPMLPAE